jgi:RHS repeat-associated protein
MVDWCYIFSILSLGAYPLPKTIYNGSIFTTGSETFDYDNNGNLITKTVGGNVTNYSWDFNDMLTQITNDGNTYIYRYDGLGSRVARIENGAEKRYVSGLVETDASGSITAYYVYGLGLISKITPSNEVYYYHYDGIGSTIGMSDSLGNMVNKYAYDAFGKVLNEEETIPNPFKYVGQFGVMDEGNGLLYMRARYYDPEIGRFISKDPIGFVGGLNLYGYVDSVGKPYLDINLYTYASNNPVNWIDPEGLQSRPIWIPVRQGPNAPLGGNVQGRHRTGGIFCTCIWERIGFERVYESASGQIVTEPECSIFDPNRNIETTQGGCLCADPNGVFQWR